MIGRMTCSLAKPPPSFTTARASPTILQQLPLVNSSTTSGKDREWKAITEGIKRGRIKRELSRTDAKFFIHWARRGIRIAAAKVGAYVKVRITICLPEAQMIFKDLVGADLSGYQAPYIFRSRGVPHWPPPVKRALKFGSRLVVSDESCNICGQRRGKDVPTLKFWYFEIELQVLSVKLLCKLLHIL